MTSTTYNMWTSGTGGTILHSSDIGATWITQTSGVVATLMDIQFATSSDGWACGSAGTVVSTQDGGTTWGTDMSGAPYEANALYFHSILSGIVLGAGFNASTTTGGNTWSPTLTDMNVQGVDFVSTSVGFACGNGGALYKTIDGGATWNLLVSGTTSNLLDIQFISPTEGWTCGYSGTILHTIDAGVTWTLQPITMTSAIASIKFFDDQFGWVCGYSGMIYQTRDGGNSWYIHTSGYTGSSLYLRDLDLISGSEGIAVGENGTIIHFQDNTDYTGINENSNLMFSLFPNPATSQLTIATKESIKNVRIFGINGNLVQTETTNSFSIETLPVGIYFATISTENGIQTERFVKE